MVWSWAVCVCVCVGGGRCPSVSVLCVCVVSKRVDSSANFAPAPAFRVARAWGSSGVHSKRNYSPWIWNGSFAVMVLEWYCQPPACSLPAACLLRGWGVASDPCHSSILLVIVMRRRPGLGTLETAARPQRYGQNSAASFLPCLLLPAAAACSGCSRLGRPVELQFSHSTPIFRL